MIIIAWRGRARIRRLTPIECERLQAFPDNWTKYGLFEDGVTREISDAQRYKCCGNAVTTAVVEDIIKTVFIDMDTTPVYWPT